MEKPCVPFPRFPSGDKTYKAVKYVIPALVTAGIPSLLFYPYFLIFLGSHLCGGGVTHLGCPCNMKDGASLQSWGGGDHPFCVKTQVCPLPPDSQMFPFYSFATSFPCLSTLHPRPATHPFSVSTMPSFQECHIDGVTHNATF